MAYSGSAATSAKCANAIVRWHIDENVTAFTTTRRGGYSKGEYGEFNINPWVGDAPEAVAMNLRLLVRQLKLSDATHLILPHQIHATTSLRITPDYFFLEPEAQAGLSEGIDTVMTDVPGVCIGVSTADCVPILLYDKAHHAAAAVHAGWRGTKERIVQKAVAEMRDAYGSDPGDMKAIIGPRIHMDDYEVGHEVWQQFHDAGFDMKRIARPVPPPHTPTLIHDTPAAEATKELLSNDIPPKYTLDIGLCNRLQLEDMGIGPHHILLTAHSSYGDADNFFSARRQGIKCGRTYTAIFMLQRPCQP